MNTSSNPNARASDAENGRDPRDKDWLAGRIAARSGSEVIVSSMPCDAVCGDEVRREVTSALKSGDAQHVERVVFLTIGDAYSNPRGNSQALIEKFLRRRQALEEWALDAGLRVVAGFLRPSGDFCSAVFDLEPADAGVVAAPVVAAKDRNGGATASRQGTGQRR